MCGIASIINIKPNRTLEGVSDKISKMIGVMRYRGPDAKGTFIDERFGALGHARLSIIATSDDSNQPFHSTSGATCISFNGEIYNYIELKKELEESHGIQFRTRSDTEVLLAAYEVWGDDCVTRFNGMWAFVIFDFSRRRVFCSRDRFGVKPFLYARDSHHIYVGSEAKAILQASPAFKKPNFKALSLLLRASIGGQNLETCFDGIYRLAPSHNMIIENGEVHILRYWEYPSCSENKNIAKVDSAAEELLDLLRDSVRLRLRSDVPVGFTLSGGLDSSGIVTVAGDLGSRGLKAYTATYDHPNYRADESEIAKDVAAVAGMEHIRVPLGVDDLIPVMSKIVHHLEAPHAAMPIIPYWKIMEVASQSIKVVLEGQGADELLGGYTSTIAWPSLMDNLMRGRFDECWRLLRNGVNGSYGMTGKDFLLMFARSMFPGLHRPFRRLRGDESVYKNELHRQTSDKFSMRDWNGKGSDRVNSTLLEQHENGLVNLLQYGDAIPMAHSVEGRLPFLDYRVVEYAARLPGTFKFQNGFSKYVLRKAFQKIVPSQITETKLKRGFDSPIGVWFREHAERIVKPILLSRACRERGLFDLAKMEKLLVNHCSGKTELTSQIFRWTVTELWFQEFID